MPAKKKKQSVEEASAAAESAVKQRLAALLNHWRKVMMLGDYELAVGWRGNPRSAAEVKIDGTYLSANIQFNLGNVLTRHSAEETEDLVIHELSHVLLAPVEQELDRWIDKATAQGAEFDDTDRKQYRRVMENMAVRLQRAISTAAETGRCEECMGSGT